MGDLVPALWWQCTTVLQVAEHIRASPVIGLVRHTRHDVHMKMGEPPDESLPEGGVRTGLLAGVALARHCMSLPLLRSALARWRRSPAPRVPEPAAQRSIVDGMTAVKQRSQILAGDLS